jgi:hypothetical protein
MTTTTSSAAAANDWHLYHYDGARSRRRRAPGVRARSFIIVAGLAWLAAAAVGVG